MESLTERQERLDKKYPPRHRWRFLGTIMAYRFIMLGIVNGSFSLILTSMIKDLGWTTVERAGLLSANSTGQLIATLIIGFLIDRVSAKKAMAFGIMLIASIACFLRGIVVDYTVWRVIMFVWGFTYSSCIVMTMKILGLWFNRKELGECTGYLTLAGPLGQLVAMQFALTLIGSLGGWQKYWIVAGVIGIVIFIIFVLICKERPNEDSAVPPNYDKKDTGLIKDLVALAKVPRLWLLWLADACQVAMISLSTTYGQIVLQNDPGWGLESAVSRRASQMVMIGAIIGYFVIPKLSRFFGGKTKDGSVNRLAFFSMICGWTTAILYTVGYMSYNWTLLLICLVIGGIGQGGFIVGPKTVAVAQPEIAGGRAGTSTSISNIIGRIGLVIVTAALGSLATAVNDNAVLMALPYGVLFCGPIFLLAFLLVNKRREKKLAAAAASVPETLLEDN